MIVAVALLGYAILLAIAAPRMLRGARWVDRAPRLGIAAWQSLTAAVVIAVILAGVSLTMPTLNLAGGLGDLLHACIAALRARCSTPAGAAVAAAGAAVAVVVSARSATCVVRAVVTAARQRARHRAMLYLTGRTIPGLDAAVLDHAEPAMYCLPGRGQRIVVTTAALALLDERQLAAALAHERAHLRQRHDLVVAWAVGLARAFPRVSLFAQAQAELTRLVELLADDAATRQSDPLTLADALLTLAAGHSPAGSVGAVGAGAARVRRLMIPRRPLRRAHCLAVIIATTLVGLAPFTAVVGPAATALGPACVTTHRSRPVPAKSSTRVSQPPGHAAVNAPRAKIYYHA